MDFISGFLERITFYNEENNFTVARIKEKGKKDLTTVVGNLAGVFVGESIKLSGKWVRSSKFGEQFLVEKYETIVPATVNGIEKYLGSGLIKGVGPVMARRIVRAFGLDTLEIIESSPERLLEVDGIGAKRAGMIARAWEEQKEIKEIMVFLQSHGVSAAYSARIYKQYGDASISVVRRNPYQLAAEIHGIGFLTADRIARSLGIDAGSQMRAEEGIIYVLSELMGEGHVYFPCLSLAEKAAELLEIDLSVVRLALSGLAEKKRLVLEQVPAGADGEPGDGRQEAAYLPAFYTAETGLAGLLLDLNTEPPPSPGLSEEKVITWVEGMLNARLAAGQKEAVLNSQRHRVLVITGGPGTGKTTIIKGIIKLFQALKLRVLLTAPTGRAAKRLQEAAGYEARTIHRLLEYSPQAGGFQKNRENPLDTDVLIVDESSMIDTILMYHLVKALPPGAALLLAGDINQLPSVGPGSVLRDIIASGRFKVVTLTEIFRQARGSRIVLNAHRINEGQFPDISAPPPGEFSDFYFIEETEPERVLNKLLALCKERIPGRFGYHPVRDIQVLTPMHRGELGVANLNARLQELLNPGPGKMLKGQKLFKLKDKVMQVVNNYQKEVFNGDIGSVISIDQEEQELKVDFDGRPVTYDFSETDELVPAYAVSIHKSQGSEYPAVVIPVTTQHYLLLQRNLIYTGVTRGRQLVVLIGSKKALAMAIRNDKPQKRYTGLRERLLAGQLTGLKD